LDHKHSSDDYKVSVSSETWVKLGHLGLLCSGSADPIAVCLGKLDLLKWCVHDAELTYPGSEFRRTSTGTGSIFTIRAYFLACSVKFKLDLSVSKGRALSRNGKAEKRIGAVGIVGDTKFREHLPDQRTLVVDLGARNNVVGLQRTLHTLR